MSVDDEIKRLADAAVDIAHIQNPDVRHRGGFWLHGELVALYDSHLFTHEQRLDFMAVVKILLDVIFRDAVEDVNDLKPFEAFSSAMEEHVKAAERGAIENETI